MMNFLIFIVFILTFYFGFRFIFRTEKRIEAKIKAEGQEKGLKVLFIRESNRFDGKNPFPAFEIRFRLISTKLFGIQGEAIYYRIVTTENPSGVNQAFWVQIETVFFRPVEIIWKETEYVVKSDVEAEYKFEI